MKPAETAKSTVTTSPAPTTKTAPVQESVTQASYDSPTYLEAGGVGVMLKVGALTLSEETQSIRVNGVDYDLIFDDSASGVFAVEVYYQFNSGLAVGGEILNYTANFTTAGIGTDEHDVDVLTVMGIVKQYFRPNSSLQPYLGAGLGVTSTDISGPPGGIAGNTSGISYQVLAGIEYRGADIGVFGEAKYLSADTEDDNNQSIDVSGTGLFAGVAFHF